MYKVILKKNEDLKIRDGYPWIYANEVQRIEGKGLQASIAEVCDKEGNVIGYGYINHASKIIVRMIGQTYQELDKSFFKERILRAKETKEALGYDNNYRVVFSESDLIPGLIVDKYGKYLSVQFLTLAIDKAKEIIIDVLKEIFSPLGIYERSDVKVREKEGLKECKGLLYGSVPESVEIIENGLKINVDIINGQKTGYFLDQKENRANIKYYCKGKSVLDCFCNVGGFGLNAASNGAKEVTCLDISERAIEEVKKNATLNNLDINAKCVDVFKALREYKQKGEKFDCIVLDPPAFTKSFDTVKEGYRGYVDINTDALALLNKNGYLLTFSCSEHLTPLLFSRMIEEAIKKAHVKAKLIEMRYQAKDHACLLNMNEALYLKCAVIQVL